MPAVCLLSESHTPQHILCDLLYADMLQKIKNLWFINFLSFRMISTLFSEIQSLISSPCVSPRNWQGVQGVPGLSLRGDLGSGQRPQYARYWHYTDLFLVSVSVCNQQGYCKYSFLFYGYYNNNPTIGVLKFRLPLSYLLVGVGIFGYSLMVVIRT